MTSQEPRKYGVSFWIVSAVWGTGILFAGAVLTLTTIFLVSVISTDDLSLDAIGTTVGAALFWAFLVLVGTCYFTVPVAALLTGGVRMMRREIRERRQEPQES